MKIKSNKLGHQAPKGYKINDFNSININGDFAYCKSHDFIYHPDIEKQNLYNAIPCYYTDNRYVDGDNFYHSTYLYDKRYKSISLKSCIRKVLKCKNIPVNTIITFGKSWYFAGKKIDNSYKFKVKKYNKYVPEYEINIPSYYKNFTTCKFSIELTNELRKNGFIVQVIKNESFLLNMINTATLYSGNNDFVNSEINEEIAIAYGYGKKIGFSSYNDDFMGYSNGCDNILYDKFGEFDKWSRCCEIDKKTPINEIIEILKK